MDLSARRFLAALLLLASAATAFAGEKPYLEISGIYPHLAAFNTPPGGTPRRDHGECGIGAVAPWAGRLWFITYPPHKRRGSRDKLYEVDEDLHLTIRPESVGGTHASRLIHRESRQLIIGPYFIDTERNVRALDVTRIVGRLTATARHLTEPSQRVYFVDMEGPIWEVDVHSLEPRRLFEKPVPGWHGKGAYTAQGRLVIANNGEHPPGGGSYDALLAGGPARSEDEAGALAEWDGEEWRVVERRQFTDVTGPGGIEGSPDPSSPLWSIGWDRRSVILKLLDGGTWSTFRLPKASHSYDPRHGWFTEWPRIREVAPEKPMMVMHGTLFDFPPSFSAGRTGGIRPLATHLRYIPDFCCWNGRVVLASDDASFMQNPLVGQPQSNLWFGTLEELRAFGPRTGWGGPWVDDAVRADDPSTPFLVAGYRDLSLHIVHDHEEAVEFAVEVDANGRGGWEGRMTLTHPGGYRHFVLPADLSAEWIRLRPDRACRATAYFHLFSPRQAKEGEGSIFDGLADASRETAYTAALVRPAGHNRSLQVLARQVKAEGAAAPRYLEVRLDPPGRSLVFEEPDTNRADEMRRIAAVETPFEVDDASVVLTDARGRRFRLPKGAPAFDEPWPAGWPRGVREAVSERYLANLHGTFYEVPRAEWEEPDFQRLKPVASHRKRIADFCTWRGLLVLSGVAAGAAPDGHVFGSPEGPALWFGSIDDLWKLGKPRGRGGPWRDTPVRAGRPSDPYLMTGYDRKRLELSHDLARHVEVTLEVDFDHRGWRVDETFRVPGGETFVHRFPAGFHAHWVRLTAARDCRATATFVYE